MKTKQAKEEQDKGIDEETVPVEPKTRARKKATDIEEDKNKPSHDEPKTSKDKKTLPKPKAIVKKRPLGIRKALRSKKAAVVKEKIKHVIKQTGKRGRKPIIKTEPETSQDKDVPLIPASEIKKEPAEDTTPNSRSSSPKTAGRRQRVGSDMAMMKTLLSDSPSTLVLGPRTSPYSMRSERSNSPSLFEGKNLRSGKPRKVKNNLLNEVVKKEQKKRRRLLSDSKNPESVEGEDCKKLKRVRSCSRDGSEISKCSDNTESDLSMSETLNDSDSRELNKKLDKSKTDLDVDIENNVQISTIEKVPSLNVDSKLAEPKQDAQTSSIVNERKKKLSLTRSTSLDADNNNSNRLKLETLMSPDIGHKHLMKTDNDSLFQARSIILTTMSEKFNSKTLAKNIRRVRRGKKAAAESRKPIQKGPAKNCTPTTVTNETIDDKQETIETLSKDIDDLIKDLDQNIDRDHELITGTPATGGTPDQMETKSVSKFYGLNKPLSNVDDNSVATPETPVKDREIVSSITNEITPSKNDDSDSIRLRYEEDTVEKVDGGRHEIAYKCNSVASIDKLMDRLKEFEEFDKRRQRQESECKSSDSKPMMVTNDVVLITKSGADIKPLKDIQSMRSPEKPLEKENVLSCFENNSAISIVKRDQVRKSLDVDLPNSVTLIKRKNSVSARKESTNSNHSRDADAISIFEKSLGKDVTLTEIRKSVDKSGTTAQHAHVDLHQFATLHPTTTSQIGGVLLDSSQISITPRVSEAKINANAVQIISKRKSKEEIISRKTSESTSEIEDKITKIDKIKSPPHHSPAISITPAPVAVKSPEVVPVEAEAVPPPPVESVKPIPDEIPVASEVSTETPILESIPDVKPEEKVEEVTKAEDKTEKTEKPEKIIEEKAETPEVPVKETEVPEKIEVEEKPTEQVLEEAVEQKPEEIPVASAEVKENEEIKEKEPKIEIKPAEPKLEEVKPTKGPGRPPKSARNSIESLAGPSNALNETPESQKRKENVLRTLGLLTHKAAKEAKIEKLREKERIYSGIMSNKGKAAKSSGDYTGTLKTVIKLNRTGGEREKKKHNRTSLKMTFQKSKYRSGKQITDVGEAANEDDTFYTIERREAASASATDGGQRKSHYSNRLNHDTEALPEPTEPKETLNLVIPEKASSFSIHPGRLCQDQCFYCGGKFGLFDTPCHIAQIKSSERQKKVLDNEEKLTIDSCLCDACYRHVDRRANCPSYRKRPLAGKHGAPPPPPPLDSTDKASSPPQEEESEDEPGPAVPTGRVATCHTEGCVAAADNSIRRKWLIKMRSSVNKVLKLKGDYPGLHTIPLCSDHYRLLSPLMACALCRRRLTKHHNLHFIHHGSAELNPLLSAACVPVQLGARVVLCKACRYYCTLLQRPGHNDNYARSYRRKLLLVYNIEVPPDQDGDPDGTIDDLNKHKKKQRNKSKQRKSTDPESNSSETSDKASDSTPEKREKDSESDGKQPLEEDIESLISSNKILVPGAVKTSETTPSDGSENEGVFDFDSPMVPVDKQTELQYLLQKQNNPAQFMQGQPNLTQKQKNFLKLQTASGIQKPGQHHRISEKNARRIQKLGLMMSKEKVHGKEEMEVFEEKSSDGIPVLKNINLNDECTIESIPNKRPADINTLKNKWQMSESFTQVKRNLSELSKKLEKDPKKPSEIKYSNPVKRLETNPSISVRELFPGEEEMNLQCNIEFNNVKGVTPEGWEKCNTVIQYDVETKRLWNELQRPYGNQSSFLRHLVLLEKYFRSGDLVLSSNALPHAANYSDSVQSRLRAYDNVVNDTPRRSEPAISLIEYRKKPSINGKSLLKSNQTEDKDPKKFMPPPQTPRSKGKEKGKSKQLPPELIAINTPNAQGRKAIQNVLHNIQQLVKGVSASDPTEVAAAPLPPVFEGPLPPPPPPPPPMPKEKKDKSDTPKKSKSSSKPWRPTLMPITQENLSRIAREPTQIAVDGRTLPSLVQVMSSGKRYHITLQDYNKMCVMRREKLQQLHDGRTETVVTELAPSAMLGNGGTVTQHETERPEAGSNAASILKNVGLKNITIAPIPAKAVATQPSPLLASTPIRIPQLSSVSITTETVMSPGQMVMPKIPKSLTVIPQTVLPGLPCLPQGLACVAQPPGLPIPPLQPPRP